MKLYTAEGG